MNPACASRYIDLTRYPIDQPGSEALNAVLTRVREAISEDGCAVLPGFIRSTCISDFVEEAEAVAPLGHRSFNRTNAYFTADDTSLPAEHPVRRFYDRSNSFVPADNFGKDSPLRRVYEWPPVMEFIRQCLDEPEDAFFRYADPLADVIVNVTDEGNGFPWHFDTNNYTVTLAIRNGERGGEFEYVPNLRTASDEHYEQVQQVLDGDRACVRTLPLEPGDLQIFKGRYSLHRVTPVRGATQRFVGIFSFVDRPGIVAKAERARQLYGRVLPVHYGAAPDNRSDKLLD